eukprot:TRINITY_DN3384_c0_g1_i1.p1 TRINITY_DN3384_c0_g1~~TRINITY_DN3384_c0_g1_i1.p1  ORF type:complete len:70 (-),score=3.62 TRINITY_DN3384_c0_g1_i1:199-408(-)
MPVSFYSAVLVKCEDATVKQLLLHLNEKHGFLIDDLDDITILIDGKYKEFVYREIERIQSENTYVAGAK